jgi:hypothetical protein
VKAGREGPVTPHDGDGGTDADGGDDERGEGWGTTGTRYTGEGRIDVGAATVDTDVSASSMEDCSLEDDDGMQKRANAPITTQGLDKTTRLVDIGGARDDDDGVIQGIGRYVGGRRSIGGLRREEGRVDADERIREFRLRRWKGMNKNTEDKNKKNSEVRDASQGKMLYTGRIWRSEFTLWYI